MTAGGIVIKIITQSFLDEFINPLKQISEKGWHEKVPLVVLISEELSDTAKKMIPDTDMNGMTIHMNRFHYKKFYPQSKLTDNQLHQANKQNGNNGKRNSP